ncbi:hypothetical protein ACS0ZG_31935 [Burkholderia gladioli]|uniref:hypothetical protein n=1 Tax=Burkholderia gladioli TaxID=28095 RepID=UPI003F7A7BFC
MTTEISAQKVLGETLAADFVKSKARRELDRAMVDGERFLDHAANFAEKTGAKGIVFHDCFDDWCRAG